MYINLNNFQVDINDWISIGDYFITYNNLLLLLRLRISQSFYILNANNMKLHIMEISYSINFKFFQRTWKIETFER